MASKIMMKNTIALVLAINLFFFGFTVAQTPPPQVLTCPRDIQACVNALRVSVILNAQTMSRCCNLVAGLDASVASVCLCNAVRITILDLLTITLRLNQVLGICRIPPPRGFICA